jgi:hypothetical protein
MGPDRIAAGITSIANSSSALYSTSAKPNFQIIFTRNARSIVCVFVPSGGFMGRTTEQKGVRGCNYGFGWKHEM